MDFKIPPNTPSVNSIFDVPKNFTGHIIITDGLYYYQNGKLHRDDGPAIEYANGDKFWYLNNKQHRTDGPAIEYKDGDKRWFYHDELYGKNNDFTNESWKYFQRTIIF